MTPSGKSPQDSVESASPLTAGAGHPDAAARPPRVVSPGMRRLLVLVLLLFALLVVDSAYLGTITFLEWSRGIELQGLAYQVAFLVHLLLGALILVPALVFAGMHMRRALGRPNRLAVRLGLTLFATLLVLLATGLALTRGLPFVALQDPGLQQVTYVLHVVTPAAVCWLFVMHRLAGRAIRWRAGAAIGAASLVLSLATAWLARPGPADPMPGSFLPARAKTTTGHLIPARELMQDEHCRRCHEDVHDQWAVSAHRFASFNNPAYLFSVRNTRAVAFERDGDVRAARFCAGCHDPVPLFSGAFDEPDFDDEGHPTAHAGITCIACHAIEAIGSRRGNADYVVGPPTRYPFAFAEHPALVWLNGILIKGKPALHKRTFLKPLHRTTEFCGTCHKVHLPVALNGYRWLRGQNHFDSFLLSGVSGHGVQSFYYPETAVSRCSECHMPERESDDFGALPLGESGALVVHDHRFPAANTAIPHLLGLAAEVNDVHEEMLTGALRVDIFAIREGEDTDVSVDGPIRPSVPTLKGGSTYVFDVVIRSLKVGHLFTEGTADSNQVWLDVEATAGDRIIGRSGAIDPADGSVDPWSYFVNAYVIDRAGNRIDRRNAEDIFTKLYDHQIPPGAADVVYYRLRVPVGETAVRVTARLRYRKFDTTYMRAFQGAAFRGNDLPIVTIATDTVVFPVTAQGVDNPLPEVAVWERWNDYGIGLLRKPGAGLLRQAEMAFRQVDSIGRPEGPLNLARVFIREGRLGEASSALAEASDRGAYPWSIAWFSGLVDLQNGELDGAIDAFGGLVETRFAEARGRGFDFSADYRLQNTLAQAYFERAKLARDDEDRTNWLQLAADRYRQALALDPENVSAHYGLTLVYPRLGEPKKATHHRKLHATYRVDDNAHDRAVTAARRKDPAANHAAESVAIYDLKRQQ